MGPPGPAGAAGPPGPAGSGSGLQVVDTNGSVVGTVGKATGGGGTVFREFNGELFALDVNTQGFVPQTDYYGNAVSFSAETFLYAAPDCSGTQYSGGYYGVATPSPTEFAHPVAVFKNGAFFARPTELKAQQYYSLSEIMNSTTATATQNCTTPPSGCPGGNALGAEHQCASSPTFTCVSCCLPDSMRTAKSGPGSCVLNPGEQQAPVHSLDLNALGTPPFKLQP
jgi:hypothetical protein